MTAPLALVLVVAAVSVVLVLGLVLTYLVNHIPETGPWVQLHKQQTARVAAIEATLRAARLGFLTNRWFRLPR